MAHDLDGTRLRRPGEPQVWLMIDGQRRLVENGAVYDALFNEITHLRDEPDLEALPEGPTLNEGTCLARPYGSLSIYLVTGYPSPTRHHVETYETLVDFRFDESKVWNVPPIVLETVPLGRPLVSGPDRQARFNRRG